MKQTPTRERQYDCDDETPNTLGRDEIVCPFCGVEYGDSWERRRDSGVEDCECGESFQWNRNVSVSYDTEPVAPKSPQNQPQKH